VIRIESIDTGQVGLTVRTKLVKPICTAP
jgi:hypothetical protein